jgi:pimeloyl-ACP methyl ester carboxylesterase
VARPFDAPPSNSPRLRLLLGELAAPLDGLRLLPALPRQAMRRSVTPRDVLVLPGWLAADRSTSVIRAALARDGHRVRGWGLGRNRGDVAGAADTLVAQLQQHLDRSGRPTDLVGWSLGGTIAREVARRAPDTVRRIVTLGTPLHGSMFTSFAALYSRSMDEAAREAVERRLATPPTVAITIIWSKRDGVVQWRAQQDRDNPWADHVEVRSTHIGMTLDPHVLDVIRDRIGSDLTSGIRVT